MQVSLANNNGESSTRVNQIIIIIIKYLWLRCFSSVLLQLGSLESVLRGIVFLPLALGRLETYTLVDGQAVLGELPVAHLTFCEVVSWCCCGCRLRCLLCRWSCRCWDFSFARLLTSCCLRMVLINN